MGQVLDSLFAQAKQHRRRDNDKARYALVTEAGLEPAPLSFEARCSIRLSDAAESGRKVKATSIV